MTYTQLHSWILANVSPISADATERLAAAVGTPEFDAALARSDTAHRIEDLLLGLCESLSPPLSERVRSVPPLPAQGSQASA